MSVSAAVSGHNPLMAPRSAPSAPCAPAAPAAPAAPVAPAAPRTLRTLRTWCTWCTWCGVRALEPQFRFVNALADPPGQQRGEDADQKHRAPAEDRHHQCDDDGGGPVADRPAGLHQPQRLAPVLRGPRFRHERGAAGPLAAHADAEKEAEHRQLRDVLRDTTERREDGIDEDAERQRARASPAIRDHPEQHAAGRRRGQRQRPQHSAGRAIHAEVGHERREDERVEHHVEGVEEPTKRRGNQRLAGGRRCFVPEPKDSSLSVGYRGSAIGGIEVTCGHVHRPARVAQAGRVARDRTRCAQSDPSACRAPAAARIRSFDRVRPRSCQGRANG
jgi:hypothetical protein